MAAAAEKKDDDLQMIEEHVETGLSSLLENYKPTYTPGGEIVDELLERYRLNADAHLPELSHIYADAFEATDLNNTTRQLYAMVLKPDLPYRTQAVADLESFVHPHFSVPLAGGTIRCSHLKESRYVMFFERPAGTTLAQLIAKQTKMHETRIIDYVLTPACKALSALRERKYSHGNIRPENFYLGETSILGECFSAPAATLGHYLYEPLERLMADPLGHGEANEKADIYALGILTFELVYGLDKLKTIPREEFIERVMRQGTYQVFAGDRDFSDYLQDFFRGVLNDNTEDRWGLEQLNQFIGGKRFNMIAPSPPKDAARPVVFGQEQIFSRRVLANAMHSNWREAVKDIRAMNLARWCETSLHRPELAERIERAMRIASAPSANDKQVTDMMVRVLAVLDPTGPLRTKSLSLRPDAMPLMLAYLAPDRGPELNHLLTMIQTNVCSFWMEQLESNKTPELSQLIWRLQKIKSYLDIKALGFGIERVLYELNPTLCCQSPLLKPYHVTTAVEALNVLDVLSKNLAPLDTSLVDRHIAAFLAAKIDLNKEIRLDDLTKIPELAQNPELIMLRLIGRAQQKSARLKLVGLSAWAGMRIEKMIDLIHNRVIRKRQKLQLRKLAATGSLNEVLSSIVNREIVIRDTDGFVQALALHDINTKRIEFLQNPMVLEYKARKMGGRMAVTISYTALTIIGYMQMTKLLGF